MLVVLGKKKKWCLHYWHIVADYKKIPANVCLLLAGISDN